MVDKEALLTEISKLSKEQTSAYQTWEVVSLIRDLAYYVVIGVIVIALGRRIINAILSAVREAKRGV